jgi:hypothetical protein
MINCHQYLIINQFFLGMSSICEGRLLISHEAPKCSGFAAEISATIQVHTHRHSLFLFQYTIPNF